MYTSTDIDGIYKRANNRSNNDNNTQNNCLNYYNVVCTEFSNKHLLKWVKLERTVNTNTVRKKQEEEKTRLLIAVNDSNVEN